MFDACRIRYNNRVPNPDDYRGRRRPGARQQAQVGHGRQAKGPFKAAAEVGGSIRRTVSPTPIGELQEEMRRRAGWSNDNGSGGERGPEPVLESKELEGKKEERVR